MANKILLKGRGHRVERVAGGTIRPGHLVKENSSGQLVVAPTALLAYVPMFAVENDLEGKTPTDAYSVNDFVQAEVLYSGCEVKARLAAAATAVVVGSRLEAAADGTLRLATTGIVIAEALEAVDNSGGGGEVFLKVRIV